MEEAIAGLKEIAPTAPGVQMFVNWQRGSGDDASLNVTLYGEDTPTLAELAEEAERRLRTLPGLTSVEPDLEAAQEELRIRIDRERALQYGVRPEAISGTIVSALRGQRLPRYRTGEKEIEMWVQYSEADRRGVGNLSALEIPSTSGKRIPLDAVADLSIARGFGDIRRTDRRTSLNIKLNTTWSSVGGLRDQVTEVMGGMDLPRGYSWDFGAARRWERQDNRNMLFGLLVSIVFIYLIMGFLFESALLPLSVMPSILLSWVGVFWLLLVTREKPVKIEPKIVPPLVRVMLAEPQDIRLSVLARGTVVPRTESDLVAEVRGRVIEGSLNLVEGGFFNAGDILLRLDDLEERLERLVVLRGPYLPAPPGYLEILALPLNLVGPVDHYRYRSRRCLR